MANRIPGLVVVGEDEQESSPIPGLIVFPGKKKKPSAIKELGRGFVEGLMSNPEAAGTIAKIAGAEEIGSAIEKKSRAIADKYRMPNELQGSVIENPSLLAKPAWWTHGMGQMAGSMVGPAGVGGGAFKVGSGILKKVISDPKTVAKAAKYIGVGAGGAAGGTMEGASTYNQVLEETGDEAKALRSGTLMAVGSAVLNSASFGSMLSPKTKSKLLHMVTAGITEGATEQAEEPWEAIVMNKPEEAAQRWLDGFNVLLPAMVTGGIGGLGGSVLTSDEKAEIRDALKKTSDLKKRTDIPGLVLESDEDSLDADEHSFLKSWLDEEDYVDFIERRKYEAQHDPAAMAAIEEEELLHQQARQPGAGAMLKDRLATEEANDFLRQEQENFDTLRRGLSQAERALGDIFGRVKSEDDADYVRLWENLDLTPVSDIIENKQEILTKRPDISPASLNDLIIKKQAEKLSRPIPEAPNPMQSEATRLGLEYVGVQEGGNVPLHLFTDPQNGSTFTVPEGESVDAALKGNRERFAPKTPVGETGDATTQPKAEEATGGGKEQAAGVLEGEKEPLVIDQEDYLTQHGASRLGIGELALHKNIPEGKQRKRLLDNQAKKDWELLKKRERLRNEYREKVEKGEIRPPTRIEKLIDTARGHPDNESTQAARRILEKRGIDWVERDAAAKVTVDQRAPEIEPQPLTIKISGGMVQTKSGRQIPAPIKVRLDSGRKATNDLKKQESWMREQALAEAKARGDEYNALQFNGMKPGKMTRANKDHALTYLFGDSDVEFEVEQEFDAFLMEHADPEWLAAMEQAGSRP